jgi:hypothetical protein
MRATASMPFIRPPRGAFRTSKPSGYDLQITQPQPLVNAGKPDEAASNALPAFPAVLPGGITSDDPWGGAAPADGTSRAVDG